MRRQILERDARMLEFADERLVFHERRDEHHANGPVGIEQPPYQTRPQDVAGRSAMRDRHEHRNAAHVVFFTSVGA